MGWTAGRLAALAARGRRRRRRARRPRPPHLDPWSLPEPWRPILQQAESVRIRFDQALTGWPPGPTRDRLAELQPQVYAELSRLDLTARQGATAGGWTGPQPAAGRPSTGSLATELHQIQTERSGLGDGASARRAELTRREEALAAELRARRRASAAEAEVHDRLSLAIARLDETLTQLLVAGTRSASGDGEAVLEELGTAIASLHAAVNETAGTPPDPATP